MLTVFDRGIYLPELDLWLDSLRKKDKCVVSHAHSDHVARHIEPILTPQSGLLLEEYYKKSIPIPLPYYQTYENGNHTITFYPAGHCLGSAQTLIQSLETGEKILYTGDFKTRFNPINKPFERSSSRNRFSSMNWSDSINWYPVPGTSEIANSQSRRALT